jgi:hypothetical protein
MLNQLWGLLLFRITNNYNYNKQQTRLAEGWPTVATVQGWSLKVGTIEVFDSLGFASARLELMEAFPAIVWISATAFRLSRVDVKRTNSHLQVDHVLHGASKGHRQLLILLPSPGLQAHRKDHGSNRDRKSRTTCKIIIQKPTIPRPRGVLSMHITGLRMMAVIQHPPRPDAELLGRYGNFARKWSTPPGSGAETRERSGQQQPLELSPFWRIFDFNPPVRLVFSVGPRKSEDLGAPMGSS